MFVAAVLDLFVANPELWENPLSTELDCCRVWVPASPEQREKLMTLGDAALPTYSSKGHVVLNTAAKMKDGTPRLRTVAGVAAELAKARAAKKAEPHESLSVKSNSLKMETLDLEAMLVVDPEGEGLLNVEGAKSLLAKWTEQVKLYDADNSYTVLWGGYSGKVAKDFKDIFRCEDGYGRDQDGKKFKSPRGVLTMRYYIKVLKDAIKDATGEEEED